MTGLFEKSFTFYLQIQLLLFWGDIILDIGILLCLSGRYQLT